MLRHLKNYRKFYALLSIIVIILTAYFFWPTTFKVSSEDHLIIQISKDINHVNCSYELNEQEVSEFVKILEKARFCHGVSKPDRMFSEKVVDVKVSGSDLSPDIRIYYDTDKTYVLANISKGVFRNMYYRISKKHEIRKFVENIVNTKISEFKKISGATDENKI